MALRTRTCTPAVVRGRRRKADQFAAADVICCASLGRHHQGDDHRGAIDLLASVDAGLARHLKTLLDLKTQAGYSHDAITLATLKKAGRAMTALVNAARRMQ